MSEEERVLEDQTVPRVWGGFPVQVQTLQPHEAPVCLKVVVVTVRPLLCSARSD